MAESSLTAVAYGFIGFYNMGSREIIPSVLLGIPLGSYLIRWMEPETFGASVWRLMRR